MNKKTIGIALALLLLLGAVTTWALWRDGESAEFTQVKQLQDKLLNDKSIPDEERDAGWREVKQKWSSFSAEEQRKLKSQYGDKKREGVAEYFALETEEERLAHIDRVVDEWDAKAAKEKATNNNSSRNKKDDNGAADAKKKSAKESGDQGKRNDPEAMREGLRNYLDGKSADERAKERIYWTKVKQRWAERHGVAK